MTLPKYSNILLATELSNHSDYTADRAKSLADTLGAKLTVVHAVEPFVAYASTYFTAEMQEELILDAKTRLDQFCQNYAVDKAHQYVGVGAPKDVILTLAEKLDCDLIVVGSHDKSWFSPIVGSTTSNLMSRAKCDVLNITVKHVIEQQSLQENNVEVELSTN